MLIYVYHNVERIIDDIEDPVAERIIKYLPETGEDEGISKYLNDFIKNKSPEKTFTRASDIVRDYLNEVRMGFRDRSLLLYDPNRRIERPPALPSGYGLTERELIQERRWHRNYKCHSEHDRDRDRPVDKGRLGEVHKRRIVISMQGIRSEDFKICDRIAGITPRWRSENKVTWHHAENITPHIAGGKVEFLCDMYLVRGEYHAGRGLNHSGGCAEYSRYTCCAYR